MTFRDDWAKWLDGGAIDSGERADVRLNRTSGYKPTDIQGPRAFSAVSVATSADGGIVYVADLAGVFKSADGGRTWAKLDPK